MFTYSVLLKSFVCTDSFIFSCLFTFSSILSKSSFDLFTQHWSACHLTVKDVNGLFAVEKWVWKLHIYTNVASEHQSWFISASSCHLYVFWSKWERVTCFTNDFAAKDLWATCFGVSKRMTPKAINLSYLSSCFLIEHCGCLWGS